MEGAGVAATVGDEAAAKVGTADRVPVNTGAAAVKVGAAVKVCAGAAVEGDAAAKVGAAVKECGGAVV